MVGDAYPEIGLTEEQANELKARRESAQARVSDASARAPAPGTVPGGHQDDEKPVALPPPPPFMTIEQLEAIPEGWNELHLQSRTPEYQPIGGAGKKIWAMAAQPAANKWGPRFQLLSTVPLLPEALLLVASAIAFGPGVKLAFFGPPRRPPPQEQDAIVPQNVTRLPAGPRS